jgi:hypothetical protein
MRRVSFVGRGTNASKQMSVVQVLYRVQEGYVILESGMISKNMPIGHYDLRQYPPRT